MEYDAKEPINTAEMNINLCFNTNYLVYVSLIQKISSPVIYLLKDQKECLPQVFVIVKN